MDEKIKQKYKKYCSECGIFKEIEKDFYKNKGQCIDCRKTYEKNKRLEKEVKIKNDNEELKNLLNKIMISIEDVKSD